MPGLRLTVARSGSGPQAALPLAGPARGGWAEAAGPQHGAKASLAAASAPTPLPPPAGSAGVKARPAAVLSLGVVSCATMEAIAGSDPAAATAPRLRAMQERLKRPLEADAGSCEPLAPASKARAAQSGNGSLRRADVWTASSERLPGGATAQPVAPAAAAAAAAMLLQRAAPVSLLAGAAGEPHSASSDTHNSNSGARWL